MLASSCVSFLLLDDFTSHQFSTDHSSTEGSSPVSPVTEKVIIRDEEDAIHDPIGIGQDFILKDETILEADACDSIAARYKQPGTERLTFPHVIGLLPIVSKRQSYVYPGTRENASRTGFVTIGSNPVWIWNTLMTSINSSQRPFSVTQLHCCLFSMKRAIPIRGKLNMLCTGHRGMGHEEIVKILLRQDMEPAVDRHTPLNTAAQLGHSEIAEMLMADERVNVNFQGKGGRTALSLAAGNGHLELVKVLLGHNSIEVDMADFIQWTALAWVVGGNFSNIVRLLVEDGRVNINYTDKEGRTAFSWAAGDGMLDIVK